MKLSNDTVLITGGTSGIGYELAANLLELGNTVIVTGRDQTKLDEAKRKLPKLHTIQSDVADPQAIQALFEKVTKEFPDLNILINNAGIMRKVNFHKEGGDLVDFVREIDINLSGPIRMVKQFLPHLKSKPSAAIVNVTSGLAFVPLAISPIYSATKAGLHSFCLSLRIQLKDTNVKVFELAPPGTETPLFKGDFTEDDVKSVKPMPVKVLAKHAIEGLKNDVYEIRPGLSNVLKIMSRVAPNFITGQLGRSAEGFSSQV